MKGQLKKPAETELRPRYPRRWTAALAAALLAMLAA